MNRHFSFARIAAVLVKEFIQMRRDRLTFGLILGVPLMQLLLFGFAINNDPKHLPTAVSISDTGTFANSIVAGLNNSGYFDVVRATNSPDAARRLLATGAVSFVVEIPANFSATWCAARSPNFWSWPMRPIQPPRPMPSALWANSPAMRCATILPDRSPSAPAPRRRSPPSSTGSTIRRSSPSTTSCRACSASSSP